MCCVPQERVSHSTHIPHIHTHTHTITEYSMEMHTHDVGEEDDDDFGLQLYDGKYIWRLERQVPELGSR